MKAGDSKTKEGLKVEGATGESLCRVAVKLTESQKGGVLETGSAGKLR